MQKNILAALLLILGAASAVYGVSIAAADSGSRFYLSWFLIAAFLFLCAYGIRSGRFAALPVFLKIIFASILIAACGILILCGVLISGSFHETPAENLDVLVVLGAQTRGRNPSRILKNRLDAASAYLKENPETRCIVSGGQGPAEVAPEGEIMADYLTAEGIPPERIIKETRSENTDGNIRLSSEYLDGKSDRIGIATSDFHVYRAKMLSRAYGWKHVSGLAAPSIRYYLPENLLRESMAVFKDIMKIHFMYK